MWNYLVVEYRYQNDDVVSFSKFLNEYGKDGWELIETKNKGNDMKTDSGIISTFICIFKKFL